VFLLRFDERVFLLLIDESEIFEDIEYFAFAFSSTALRENRSSISRLPLVSRTT
jgi:hypothetical protein